MPTQNLSSLWSVPLGSRVHQISGSRDGSQIAVGTAQASVVLDARTGGLESDSGSDKGPVTAVGFTSSGQLLVGSRGSIHLRDPSSGSVLATLELSPADDEAVSEDNAVFIAHQPGGELFGIASSHGRYAQYHSLLISRVADPLVLMLRNRFPLDSPGTRGFGTVVCFGGVLLHCLPFHQRERRASVGNVDFGILVCETHQAPELFVQARPRISAECG